jgi:hypothetical protein
VLITQAKRPVVNPFYYPSIKVVKGDLHTIGGIVPNARGKNDPFVNNYSDNSADYFPKAPFRVMQNVVMTPYPELHETPDKELERKAQTAPLSENYKKTRSVDTTELHLEMGFKDLSGTPSDKGKPPLTKEEYFSPERNKKFSEITLEARGKDGAMPFGTLWATEDIQWRLTLTVWADGNGANPLVPKVEYIGKHDSYPAFEIIALQSDGSYIGVHRKLPAAGAKPGPSSLEDGNSANVKGVKTITK